MHEGIIFAVISALGFAVWTIFHNKAAPHIDNLFGAIIVSLTAVIIGTILFLPKLKTATLWSDPKGLLFVILAGVSALIIDYFALKAYATGLEISIGGPIIIGGSMAIAALFGILIGESVTLLKLVGIFMIIIGGGILAAVTG